MDYDRWKIDLKERGFDIVHEFNPKWYNEWVRNSKKVQLLLDEAVTEAFLVGNTKLFWKVFKSWLKSQEMNFDHPVDTYCKESIDASITNFIAETQPKSNDTRPQVTARQPVVQIYWSWECEADKLVDMQRLAAISGLAYFDEGNSFLSIHPIFGAWISYRAVVLFKGNSRPSHLQKCCSPPLLLPNPMSRKEQVKARERFREAVRSISSNDSGFQGCREAGQNIKRRPEAWIAVRDCVQIGRECRFDEDQLLYHYSQDRKYLI